MNHVKTWLNSFVVIPCIMASMTMLLAGCAMSPKELVNFDQASSMSRENALQTVRTILGDEWVKDPYVFAGARPICSFAGIVRGDEHIKVSWEQLKFAYTQDLPKPIGTGSWFRLNNGDSSCKQGGIYAVELGPDQAKILATALSALGAQPN